MSHNKEGARLQWRHKNIRRLAQIQNELRAKLARRLEEEKLTIGTFSRQLDVGWSDVNRFLQENRVICGGKILRVICEYLKVPEMRREIEACAKDMPDRMLGLATLSEAQIKDVFDIHAASQKSEMNQRDFSLIFSPHNEVVWGVLQYSSEMCGKLSDKGIREGIFSILHNPDWEGYLEIGRSQAREQISGKLKLFQDLVQQLRPRYQFQSEVATALGVHRTTLHKAMIGEIGGENLDEMIENAKKLLEQKPASNQEIAQPRELTHKSEPPKPDRQKTDLTAIINRFGGETSPLGVPFVLGPDSFREIEGGPGKEGVSFARVQIQLARGLLNLFAQLKDAETRKMVREQLSDEVEELELAVRLFTAQHPNRLTELHQAQRMGWSGSKPTKKR